MADYSMEELVKEIAVRHSIITIDDNVKSATSLATVDNSVLTNEQIATAKATLVVV